MIDNMRNKRQSIIGKVIILFLKLTAWPSG